MEFAKIFFNRKTFQGFISAIITVYWWQINLEKLITAFEGDIKANNDVEINANSDVVVFVKKFFKQDMILGFIKAYITVCWWQNHWLITESIS